MNTTNRKETAIKTTYHRDGTVTFWSVYEQEWVRMPAAGISDATLATLTDAERVRIARIIAR